MMPFLVIVIMILVFFTVVTRFRSKGYGKDFEKYVNEEREANSIKGRALSPDEFFTVDLSIFPIKKETGLSEDLSDNQLSILSKQREVIKQAEKKMIKFDEPKTNIELKHTYGTANLEVITEYEGNFHAFIHAVNDWAKALIAAGDFHSAEAALLGAVKCGAETSRTYTMLIDIYLEQNKKSEMQKLYELVSACKIPAKDKVRQYFEECAAKMGIKIQGDLKNA